MILFFIVVVYCHFVFFFADELSQLLVKRVNDGGRKDKKINEKQPMSAKNKNEKKTVDESMPVAIVRGDFVTWDPAEISKLKQDIGSSKQPDFFREITTAGFRKILQHAQVH